MPLDWPLTWMIFITGASLVMLVFLLSSGSSNRLTARVRVLAEESDPSPDRVDIVMGIAHTTLPKMGAILLPKSEAEQTKLQTRLINAGFYGRQAVAVFLGIKLLLTLIPVAVAVSLWASRITSPQAALLIGMLGAVFGLIIPSFWLDWRKADRQGTFRRSLPDALDTMVICLEGGTSLPAAIQKVAIELRDAHPLLASELNIARREIQLGRSTGDALRQFSSRCDLEEIRSLASVILQSERFGASLVRALRVHADTLRGKRLQRAEEMAQKAVVKLLFPTVIFILPALFIIILGPLTLEALKL